VSKILITGGTGLIGRRLTAMLQERGHTISLLSRSRQDGPVKSWLWDVEKHFVEEGAFEGVDTIIHLAGAGIADKPWTKSRKLEILESRTHSSRLLYEELKKGNHTVTSFVAASAIGYYGFKDEDRMLKETDAPGDDYLAGVVRKWEEEVDQISSLNIRVVKIRVGVALSMDGGALREIVKPVQLFAGAPLGSGKQYLSWIHLDDLCRMFIEAVENPSFEGPYNGVAPGPITNRDLTKAIARKLKRPLILPAIPGFALRILFGEMADLVLKGNRVSSEKIEQAGFEFSYPTIDKALDDLLSRR
jgi:TIGR01777 family protein